MLCPVVLCLPNIAAHLRLCQDRTRENTGKSSLMYFLQRSTSVRERMAAQDSRSLAGAGADEAALFVAQACLCVCAASALTGEAAAACGTSTLCTFSYCCCCCAGMILTTRRTGQYARSLQPMPGRMHCTVCRSNWLCDLQLSQPVPGRHGITALCAAHEMPAGEHDAKSAAAAAAAATQAAATASLYLEG
jgi:hypothetical protein